MLEYGKVCTGRMQLKKAKQIDVVISFWGYTRSFGFTAQMVATKEEDAFDLHMFKDDKPWAIVPMKLRETTSEVCSGSIIPGFDFCLRIRGQVDQKDLPQLPTLPTVGDGESNTRKLLRKRRLLSTSGKLGLYLVARTSDGTEITRTDEVETTVPVEDHDAEKTHENDPSVVVTDISSPQNNVAESGSAYSIRSTGLLFVSIIVGVIGQLLV